MILSPLTGSANLLLEDELQVDFITKLYSNIDVDVKRFFKDLEKVQIYKCLDTNFRFYYPPIMADDDFYHELSKFKWYYMENKWEFDKTIEMIDKNNYVLEIGCGNGDFLMRLEQKGIRCLGLEFNRYSNPSSGGFKILNESIQNHEEEYRETYDMICMFQVLEHIYDVKEFMNSTVNVLKPGGRLIISVPNNDSFLGLDKNNMLNMPPHHMGLWNEKSLSSLEKIFRIRLLNIYFEPLQKYHFRNYLNVVVKFPLKIKYGMLGDLIFYFIYFPVIIWLKIYSKKINGHTIMAEYLKI